MKNIAHWIDNADSYICSHCGYETNNPNKEALGPSVCPRCFAKMMEPKEIYNNGKYRMVAIVE